MTAATNRRNRRATTRSRRRACSQRAADRLTTMQVGGTTGTISWFSRGAMRNQYETGAIKATYSYTDINNNLRVAQDAAGLTTSTYDGDNLRRKTVSASVTTTFVWDGSDYLQIKPSTGDATLLIALEGEVVGHVKGSEKRDYIVDPLGSVVAYLNSSQTLTDQFEYWPYGELVTEVETEVQPFLWVGSLGYFRDSDLRTYIRAREYRQDLGSWMQLDPLWPEEPAFRYGASSPHVAIDPTGQQGWPIPRPLLSPFIDHCSDFRKGSEWPHHTDCGIVMVPGGLSAAPPLAGKSLKEWRCFSQLIRDKMGVAAAAACLSKSLQFLVPEQIDLQRNQDSMSRYDLMSHCMIGCQVSDWSGKCCANYLPAWLEIKPGIPGTNLAGNGDVLDYWATLTGSRQCIACLPNPRASCWACCQNERNKGRI